ncbi:MAG: hypothetical protein R3301_09030, partial [Saprospiraceae bacterium]|nr:hypothetical protein [Saprospiraceae bacterium]
LSSNAITPGLTFLMSNRRVGIGTFNPQQRLHLVGDMRIEDPTPGIFFNKNNGGGQVAKVYATSDDNLWIENVAPGSMLFKTGGGGATRMTIDQNGNVGIGTDAPAYTLDLESNISRSINVQNNYTGSATKYGALFTNNSAGTGLNVGVQANVTAHAADPSDAYGLRGHVFGNGSNANLIGVQGFINNAGGGTGNQYAVYANAPLVDPSASTYSFAVFATGNSHFANDVRIGHLDDVPGYALSVDGKIIAEELKVQLSGSWPDYVFDPGYALKSPAEIEQFIGNHGRLPGVPSAAEVESNGLEVGQMHRILLEKVEELTLLVIEQDKRIRELEAQRHE